LILNNIAQCLFLIPVGLIFIYFAGSIVKVPIRFLIPTVLIISVFGCFATDGNASGAITLCIFSVIGWTMARYHYPPSAMVVGLLLGGMFETEAIKSMQLSAGNIFYFLERPGGVAIFGLILLSTGYAIYDKFKKKAAQGV
jgi:putative tricarboxylic transport membrane protein